MEITRRFPLPGRVLRIPPTLLVQLAEQAEAGYRTQPWGGPEIGGLLLGSRRADALTVSEIRPIQCEHELGPSFHLSPADSDELSAVLSSIAAARRLEVIGWYHSASHRALHLDDESKALAERFFVEPWHVSLLIRRGRSVETEYGFFTRNTLGSLELALRFPLKELPSFEDDRSTTTVEQYSGAAGPAVAVPHARITSIDAARPPASADTVAPGDESLLAFFGLREEPFADALKPAFYFESVTHGEALANLSHGVWARRGVLLLTGERQAGKSLLLACLAEDLKQEGSQFALLTKTPTSVIALYQTLARELQLPGTPVGPSSVRNALAARAAQCLDHSGRGLVVLIDNAHQMDFAVLRELEFLSFEGSQGKLVQVVLAGETSLEGKLSEPALASLDNCVAGRSRLQPLTIAETAGYIDLRLSRAGVTPADLVPRGLAEPIYQRTAGVPGRINSLCSALLNSAHESRERTLTLALLDRLDLAINSSVSA